MYYAKPCYNVFTLRMMNPESPSHAYLGRLPTWLKELELNNDKSCSWMEVECLGACVNAPILQVNDDFYGNMDSKKLNNLLAKLKSETENV